MKKQNYSKPFMVAEKFTPQEYVAKCIKVGKGGLNGHWSEGNGVPGIQEVPVNPNQAGNEAFKDWLSVAKIMDDGTGRIATDDLHSNAEGWVTVRLAPGEWPKMIEQHPYFNLCRGYQANTTRYWRDVDGVEYFQNWSVADSAYSNAS